MELTSARRARLASRCAFAALLVVVAIASMASGTQAQTVPISTAAGFESNDGNLDPQSPIFFDWNCFSDSGPATCRSRGSGPVNWTPAGAVYQTVSTTAGGWQFKGFTDAFGAVDTIIGGIQGGTVSHDTECPPVISGNVTSNADLKRAYVAYNTVRQQDGSDHLFLMLAWVRNYQSDAANVAVVFEFNQGLAGLCSTGSGALVRRTAGDFLIQFALQGGSVSLSARRWSASTSTWSDPPTDLAQSGWAQGAVNTGAVVDMVAPTQETLVAAAFGEVGVDLTRSLSSTTGTSCASFNSVEAVTRSSTSWNSALGDVAGPAAIALENCGTLVVRKVTQPSPDPTSSTAFTFTATGPNQPGGSTFPRQFNLGDGQSESMRVAAGQAYSIAEQVPPYWELTSATCTNPSNEAEPQAPTNVSVGPNERVTCTFTDTSTVAVLALNKTTVGGTGGPFTFTLQPTSGQNGHMRTLVATTSAQNVPQLAELLTAEDATDTLPPGSYLISETSPTPPAAGGSWTPADLPVCASGANSVPVTRQGDGYEIDLAAATRVSCTFSNTYTQPTGAIVITKGPAGVQEATRVQASRLPDRAEAKP